MLCERGDGKEQVAQTHGGRGHEDVLDHVEFHFLKGLEPALALRIGGVGDTVGCVEPCHLQRIRLAGLQSIQNAVRMCDNVSSLETAIMLKVGDLLLHHAFRELLRAFVAPFTHEGRGYGQGYAARNIQIAQNSGKD